MAINCSLQPFIQDYNLASYITNVVCFNFIQEWRNPHIKVEQISVKLFMTTSIYSQSFCEKSAEEKFFNCNPLKQVSIQINAMKIQIVSPNDMIFFQGLIMVAT